LQGVARTILGFGLLFFGMTLMSNELKNISSLPHLRAFLPDVRLHAVDARSDDAAEAVLGAVGIGTALTILVQSSSATIGLTIALANSGLINFWTAIPSCWATTSAPRSRRCSPRSTPTARPSRPPPRIRCSTCWHGLHDRHVYVHIGEVPVSTIWSNSFTAGDVFIGEDIGRHVAMGHSLSTPSRTCSS
jgi:hypothetical protein